MAQACIAILAHGFGWNLTVGFQKSYSYLLLPAQHRNGNLDKSFQSLKHMLNPNAFCCLKRLFKDCLGSFFHPSLCHTFGYRTKGFCPPVCVLNAFCNLKCLLNVVAPFSTALLSDPTDKAFSPDYNVLFTNVTKQGMMTASLRQKACAGRTNGEG